MRRTPDMLPTNAEFPIMTDREPDPWRESERLEVENRVLKEQIRRLSPPLSSIIYLHSSQYRMDGDNVQRQLPRRGHGSNYRDR